MLIQSTHPTSIETALFYVSDCGNQNFLNDWMPGAGTFQIGPRCDDHSHGPSKQIVSITEEQDADPSCPLNFPRSSLDLPNISKISESSAHSFVYTQRKMCPKCDERSHGGCRRIISVTEETRDSDPSHPFDFPRSSCQLLRPTCVASITEEKRGADPSCPLNFLGGSSQLPNISSIPERSAHNLVYRRRRICTKCDEHSHSGLREIISITEEREDADPSCPLNSPRDSSRLSRPKCEEQSHGGCREIVSIPQEERDADTSALLNFPASSSQPPSNGRISESSAHNLVYRRRMMCQKCSEHSHCGYTEIISVKEEKRNSDPSCSLNFPSSSQLLKPKSDKHSHGGCRQLVPVTQQGKNAGPSCPLNVPRCSSQLPTINKISESSAHNLVYKRRKMCLNCDECSNGGCGQIISITEEERETDPSCPLNFPKSSSQLSSISKISESSAHNSVYRRRKLCESSVPLLTVQATAETKKCGDCLSVITSDARSAPKAQHVVSQVEHETKAVETIMPSVVCNREFHVSKAVSVNGCSVLEEPEAPRNRMHKIIEVDSINDSCSSSKSNVELLSATKTEVDDAGECSSSSVVVEVLGREYLSAKDLCITILRSHGLLYGLRPPKICAFAEGKHISCSSSSSRLCKICGHSDTAINMLICDNCEEAFHVSCCNPRIKKIPSDEWLCHSCSKKTHKILEEPNVKRSQTVAGELGRSRNFSSKGESNPIELMLRDTEPYTTGVRVGKDFQAEVPEWSGPINEIIIKTVGQPLEVNPPQFVGSNDLHSDMPSKPSSIGNWLQCREVIDGVREDGNGTICGKWRRAPLFEVQTDDWECFCSILWDPSHADCAVPQELETDQVLKQLKYIEMLRPRLAAKRRKTGSSQELSSRTCRGSEQYTDSNF